MRAKEGNAAPPGIFRGCFVVGLTALIADVDGCVKWRIPGGEAIGVCQDRRVAAEYRSRIVAVAEYPGRLTEAGHERYGSLATVSEG